MAHAPCLRQIVVLILTTCVWSGVSAGGSFQITSEIRNAYQLMLDLRLEEAGVALERLAVREPDNLMVQYLSDYVDFLTVFITDDIDLYKETRTDRELRMRIVSMGEVSSPYYLFVQAEMYIHRGLLRFRFGEEFYGATDINQAFKLLKRNQKRYPGFSPNLKSLGVLKAGFGTIPESYRWAVELLSSMEGSVEEGLNDLQTALKDESQMLHQETEMLYLLSLLHFKNAPEEALEYARVHGIRADQGVLQCFVLSHIALKAGQNDVAINWLQPMATEEHTDLLPQLGLMYGTAKLERLDGDADVPIKVFLAKHQGQSYRKEALLKLAWHALVHGDVSGYDAYMARCRTEGAAIIESDKYAVFEANKKQRPNPELLRIRLLSDGGYYFQALDILESLDYGVLPTLDQIEFRYRAGRIYQHIGREYDALFSYKLAMSMGRNRKEYYACAAALYTGEMYEVKEENGLAEEYFRICLGIAPETYQDGLHQKAKAGLERVIGK